MSDFFEYISLNGKENKLKGGQSNPLFTFSRVSQGQLHESGIPKSWKDRDLSN